VRFSIEKKFYFCSDILIALSRFARRELERGLHGKGFYVVYLWHLRYLQKILAWLFLLEYSFNDIEWVHQL